MTDEMQSAANTLSVQQQKGSMMPTDMNRTVHGTRQAKTKAPWIWKTAHLQFVCMRWFLCGCGAFRRLYFVFHSSLTVCEMREPIVFVSVWEQVGLNGGCHCRVIVSCLCLLIRTWTETIWRWLLLRLCTMYTESQPEEKAEAKTLRREWPKNAKV